jgi:hypothetical protein
VSNLSQSETMKNISLFLLVIAFATITAAKASLPPANKPGGTDLQTNAIKLQKYQGTDVKRDSLEAQAEALTKVPGEAVSRQILDTRFNEMERTAAKMNQPNNAAPASKAQGQAQSTQAGNSAADIARDQAVAAIDYCSRFLKNFTTEKGNRWNRFRDNVFVPMALLLLLPGAVMAQVRAIIAQSNPVVGMVSPIEGIQRSIIAVFLIPGSYLIVNYAVDLANSISFTISTEYKNLFGSDMYEDAMCAEIRAFGVRYLSENEGSLKVPEADLSPIHNGMFSPAEGKLWGKLQDPCAGLYLVPANRDDASMPSSCIAARAVLFSSNAGMATAWALLCAFQMAFFYYLFFVGPIMAALWVYPVKFMRDAFGNWCEGVLTLCFWNLFWTSTICLLACFKGTDDTGLFMVTALNFLATGSVKHAFDFAGLVKAAGQKAADLGEKMGKAAASGGK